MDDRRCKGVRRDGTPCAAPPHGVGEDGWCWAHSPSLESERQEARSRGGRNRATTARIDKLVPDSLRPILATLTSAMTEVHDGDLDPRQASAMASLAGAIARLYQAAIVDDRITALEQQLAKLQENGGSSQWPA